MLRILVFLLKVGLLAGLGCRLGGEQPLAVTAEAQAGADESANVVGQDPESMAEHFEFTSYAEVQERFEQLNYTPEAWQAGIREVPRLYLTNVPPRWKDRVSQEVTVLLKKQLFFRAMAPLVLRANELVSSDRRRLEAMAGNLGGGTPLSEGDQNWLYRLAVQYRVMDAPEGEATAKELDKESMGELLSRVDIVPPSLALSQCVEESGWGTSRFAAEGNAIFGQWTWSETGMKPENQRSALGDHRIAAFETPLMAVMAYIHNLNTHPAYAELRTRRAQMRRNSERLSGWELAKALTRYSERGEAYIETLHAIMRVNRLDPADDAYLSDGPTYYLVPVGEGAN